MRVNRIKTLLDAGFHRHDGMIITVIIFNKLLTVFQRIYAVYRRGIFYQLGRR